MRGIHGQPVSLASAARDVADLRGRCAASLVHPGGRRTRADPKRGLEEHLGARVFQRRHRGIELAPDGRTLLEGVRAGLDSVLLASERVRKQRRVGVLVHHTLIECEAAEAEDVEFTWWTWLNRFGLQAGRSSRQLRFSDFGMALSAAVDGLGIVLGRSPMVDAELAAGRLVQPFAKGVVAKAANAFALAWRNSGAIREDQRMAAFRDFALDEACGCELAAGPCGMPTSEKDTQTRAVWMAGRAARRALVAGRS